MKKAKTETLKSCPICGHEGFEPYLTCRDFSVTQEDFSLESCPNCGFVLTNPRPAETEIGRYYQSESYISHSNTSKGLIATAYQAVRQITLKQKLRLINSLSPQKGLLLDMGCGTGHFLQVSQQAGWQVAGFEPDPQARRRAEEILKVSLKAQPLDELARPQYQIITMWHVLEHVHRLTELADWLHKSLLPDGHLLIAVPNREAYDAAHFGPHWAAYDVPRHLYHFRKQDIIQLFEPKGWEVAAMLPMPMDAFYVGMLSTRYRDGQPSYAEAIRVGLTSNRLARKGPQNSSSIIYILRKRV